MKPLKHLIAVTSHERSLTLRLVGATACVVEAVATLLREATRV